MESNQNGTTSISQLPQNNKVLNNIEVAQMNNNVVLTKNEVIAETTAQMANPMMQQIPTSMPEQNQQQNQGNYNELISQLQKANADGATSLPSRDIPIDPAMVNNDVQIKPNFIPPPPTAEDYIQNDETPEDLLNKNKVKQSNIDSLDAFYNEFQLPLLISVLYFLFQLPIFRKTVKKIFPSLFGADANPNLYGYLFNSVLFAVLFYVLLKSINQITYNIS